MKYLILITILSIVFLINSSFPNSNSRNKRRLRLREVSARIGVRGLLDTGELEKGNLSIDYEALNWVESQEVSEIESIKFLNE